MCAQCADATLASLGRLPGGVAAARCRGQIIEEAQRRTDDRSPSGTRGCCRSFDAGARSPRNAGSSSARVARRRASRSSGSPRRRRSKGVALLIVNHPDRPSDQWMWTPAIERDRRIALQDRSTRFFGTDFSFEDLEERDVNQYDYTLLGEEDDRRRRCWKIQSTPQESKSVAVHDSPSSGSARTTTPGRADRELHQGHSSCGALDMYRNPQGPGRLDGSSDSI